MYVLGKWCEGDRNTRNKYPAIETLDVQPDPMTTWPHEGRRSCQSKMVVAVLPAGSSRRRRRRIMEEELLEQRPIWLKQARNLLTSNAISAAPYNQLGMTTPITSSQQSNHSRYRRKRISKVLTNQIVLQVRNSKWVDFNLFFKHDNRCVCYGCCNMTQ